MQLLGRHDVVGNGFDQRRGQRRHLADPSRHGGAIELDALARIDPGLPVQRQMIAIFADQDVRQQPCAGLTTLDRQRRHLPLHHGLAPTA